MECSNTAAYAFLPAGAVGLSVVSGNVQSCIFGLCGFRERPDGLEWDFFLFAYSSSLTPQAAHFYNGKCRILCFPFWNPASTLAFAVSRDWCWGLRLRTCELTLKHSGGLHECVSMCVCIYQPVAEVRAAILLQVFQDIRLTEWNETAIFNVEALQKLWGRRCQYHWMISRTADLNCRNKFVHDEQ